MILLVRSLTLEGSINGIIYYFKPQWGKLTEAKVSSENCILGIFCCHLSPFSKQTFSKNSFMNTIRVSNCLDPDQDQHFVSPGLGPNCLQGLAYQRMSKVSISKERVNSAHYLDIFIRGEFNNARARRR